jgi:excisionase family DNA binding protein
MTARHAPAVARTLAQLRERDAIPMDVTEAAELLGIGRSTAYSAIKAGLFPAETITVQGRIKVLPASLLRLLEGEAAGSR